VLLRSKVSLLLDPRGCGFAIVAERSAYSNCKNSCRKSAGPCDPGAGLTFIYGLTNAEDLVQVPGTPWIVASGLADGEHVGGTSIL